MAEPILAYSVTHSVDHGYGKVRISLQTMRPASLASRLAGCIGNADRYYGGQEAADRLAKEYSTLIRSGYETTYNAESCGVAFEWQEYNRADGEPHGYCCSCRVELPTEWTELQGALKLLADISRRLARAHGVKAADLGNWHWSDPRLVLQAVQAVCSCRVEYQRMDDTWSGYWTEARQEIVRFRLPDGDIEEVKEAA